jgi:ribosomal 50S subunit-recycling heat shock protein
MLRTGKIKVNGKKKDQTYKIEDADEITLWMSDEEIERLKNQDSKLRIQNKDIGMQDLDDQSLQS